MIYKPQYWHKDSCICRKCLRLKAERELVEMRIIELVQSGRTGVITAKELGVEEKVAA